jgi:hypothetical protein
MSAARIVLRSRPIGIDERPFEMNRHDLRAVGRGCARDRLDRVLQIAARGRERRRRERGRSVARVKGEDARRRLVVRVHEIGAVAPVHVDVDEAGRQQTLHALRVGRHACRPLDVDEHTVLEADQDVVANRSVDEGAAMELFHLFNLYCLFSLSRADTRDHRWPRG